MKNHARKTNQTRYESRLPYCRMMPNQWDFTKLRFYATEGDPEAQREMGLRYLEGNEVPKDETEAVRWFRLAAGQGDIEARYRLGECYKNGVGVEPDDRQARKWYRRAALKGHTGASAALGARYRAIAVWIGFLLAVIGGAIGYQILGGILGAVLVFILIGLLAYGMMKA